MTYRQLRSILDNLSVKQLDTNIKIELAYSEEIVPGTFCFAGPTHDSLPDGYPLILEEI